MNVSRFAFVVRCRSDFRRSELDTEDQNDCVQRLDFHCLTVAFGESTKLNRKITKKECYRVLTERYNWLRLLTRMHRC